MKLKTQMFSIFLSNILYILHVVHYVIWLKKIDSRFQTDASVKLLFVILVIGNLGKTWIFSFHILTESRGLRLTFGKITEIRVILHYLNYFFEIYTIIKCPKVYNKYQKSKLKALINRANCIVVMSWRDKINLCSTTSEQFWFKSKLKMNKKKIEVLKYYGENFEMMNYLQMNWLHLGLIKKWLLVW